SAKSWLSHAAVDRLAPILPWGAGDDVRKVSPVQASASYLAHVRAAWNWHFPPHPLEEQDIVLTVPASFDEGARELTVQAARMAGLPHLRLLEEPQAAFYDWLFRQRAVLAEQLADTRLILVCDVGGGTTDLTLIKVEMRDGQPDLTRIGVGKHLMLGGDNMDLALAHLAEARMMAGTQEGKLSAARLSQLLERCRGAKELLLGEAAPERAGVTLLGAGARVVGGARTVELTRDEVVHTLVEGFFPLVAPDEAVRQRRSAIVEFGLPYASDPAVTRHVAAFLARHADTVRDALGLPQDGSAAPAVPDALLLNGGVFRAGVLAQRLQDTLARWRGTPLRLLHNDNPDVAVARGAVAYTLARAGIGAQIGGGAARSYFLVLDERQRRAVCILPRGAAPGAEVLLHERSFALRVGQPVRFHLVSSTIDQRGGQPYRPGDLVELDQGDFARLPPIATVLRQRGGGKREVPVQLATMLTEIGTLDLHCVSVDDPAQRWKLEFQLRDAEAADRTQGEAAASLPPRLAEALESIDRIFGARAQKVPHKEVRQLRARLEKLIGQRDGWDLPVLRRLCDALLQRARGRRRSAEHERTWLNLAGYCLRPGFGYPLDDWRVGQLWAIFEAGAQYRNDTQVRSEWWTMWRRIAGGLEREAQLRLLEDFARNVQIEEAGELPAGFVRGGQDDMLRLAAALERIPSNYKMEIGDWLLGLLQDAAAPPALVLWALARIGARQPFYGSAHDVVPPDLAAGWIDTVMRIDWKHVEGAPFAAAHLARRTGDRARDLPPQVRFQVVRRLEAANAPPAWAQMVRETVQLDESAERSFLGDSLPPGLKLIA
ncbi:MAG TPA: Hsp70 family protein, partial [Noviherbaspirillum sp.]|nr:Hsp70 family protein [Noviherbaspirillum sp.]